MYWTTDRYRKIRRAVYGCGVINVFACDLVSLREKLIFGK